MVKMPLNKWRFVDSPMEIKKFMLSSFEGKDFLAQQKLDGWCTYLVKDDGSWLKSINIHGTNRGDNLFFLSKRELSKGGPTDIPVSSQISNEIKKIHIPPKTVLICEWMKRRTQDTSIGEKLFVYDILYYNGEWVGNLGAMDRFQKVISLSNESLPIPDWTKTKFADFYEKQKSFLWTEGIVLKKINAPIKGNFSKSEDSGSLIKCKWRSGSSGRDIVEDTDRLTPALTI